MRALIGLELVRKLTKRNVDIRDSKLPGFTIRCRTSGKHTYRQWLNYTDKWRPRDGRGEWRTLGRVGVLDLVTARREALAALNDPAGTAKRRTSDTLGAFLTDQYETWAVENRATGAGTVARLRAIFADFLNLPLAEINAFAVERWRTARLKDGIKPATVNRDLASLRGALTKAREWGAMTANPLAMVKASRVDSSPHVRFLSDDEELRLRAALVARDAARRAARDSANEWRRARGYDLLPTLGIYSDHLTPVVLVAVSTGLRRGELLALKWADVDLLGALLTVRGEHTKNARTRHVPLNSDVAAVLKTWRAIHPKADGSALVFPGEGGERLGGLKTAWQAVLDAAKPKISDFRFHDLRHTFASKLVQAGVDLNTVRELLGHADLKMTLRYAHLAPEHRAAAVAKLVRA